MTYPLTDRLDYERGAVCDRCEKPFALGEPYALVPDSQVDEWTVCIAICVSCQLGDVS